MSYSAGTAPRENDPAQNVSIRLKNPALELLTRAVFREEVSEQG